MLVGLDVGGWPASACGPDVKACVPVVRTAIWLSQANVKEWGAKGLKIVYLAGSGSEGQAGKGKAFGERLAAEYTANKSTIVALELCNEVLLVPVSATSYLTFLREVREAMDAKLGKGTYAPLLASGEVGGSMGFVEELIAKGAGNYVDGFVCHPYTNKSLEGQRGCVEKTRRLSGKPVWVTEVGWTTKSMGGWFATAWTEAQQAEAISNFVKWCAATGFVAYCGIFQYIDGSAEWFGVESAFLKHKASYMALAVVSSL